MIAPDSSVLIPALASFHRAHELSRVALSLDTPRLISHVAFETVSVLTRMPEGQRLSPEIAFESMTRTLARPWLTLDARSQRSALARACAVGLRGGALYDALIAATAAKHGVTLLSADRRALPAYEAMGAAVSFVGS